MGFLEHLLMDQGAKMWALEESPFEIVRQAENGGFRQLTAYGAALRIRLDDGEFDEKRGRRDLYAAYECAYSYNNTKGLMVLKQVFHLMGYEVQDSDGRWMSPKILKDSIFY
jgi:hypothetical protein